MPKRIGDPSRRRRHFLLEWRVGRGLTQDDLADKMDTSKASISRVENFETGYTQEFMELAADILGTHPGVILTRPPSADELGANQTRRRKRS